MTNYNDGNWHGWNGGGCPVHPETLVQAIWRGASPDGEIRGVTRKAGAFYNACWIGKPESPLSTIEWFRVVKEHREPREFWLCFVGGYRNVYDALEDAQKYKNMNKGAEIIHVREVLP